MRDFVERLGYSTGNMYLKGQYFSVMEMFNTSVCAILLGVI